MANTPVPVVPLARDTVVAPVFQSPTRALTLKPAGVVEVVVVVAVVPIPLKSWRTGTPSEEMFICDHPAKGRRMEHKNAKGSHVRWLLRTFITRERFGGWEPREGNPRRIFGCPKQPRVQDRINTVQTVYDKVFCTGRNQPSRIIDDPLTRAIDWTVWIRPSPRLGQFGPGPTPCSFPTSG